jgi:hypothetical protein
MFVRAFLIPVCSCPTAMAAESKASMVVSPFADKQQLQTPQPQPQYQTTESALSAGYLRVQVILGYEDMVFQRKGDP